MAVDSLALIGILGLGIAAGMLLANAYVRYTEARLEADEEAVAEVEELYAAWAGLRDGTRRDARHHGGRRCDDRGG